MAATETTLLLSFSPQVAYLDGEKEDFARDALQSQQYRKHLMARLNQVHQLTQLRSEMQASARNAMREDMRTKLVNRDEIAKFLTPEFPVGCRRLTPGPGFLEAFQRDNVSGNARQGWDR